MHGVELDVVGQAMNYVSVVPSDSQSVFSALRVRCNGAPDNRRPYFLIRRRTPSRGSSNDDDRLLGLALQCIRGFSISCDTAV